jgi:hypothetical protein
MRRPEVRRLVTTRVRQEAGPTAPTAFFTYPGGGQGNSRVGFIRAEHVPDFEGERAFVEAVRVSAKPWPYWRVTRVLELLPPA